MFICVCSLHHPTSLARLHFYSNSNKSYLMHIKGNNKSKKQKQTTKRCKNNCDEKLILLRYYSAVPTSNGSAYQEESKAFLFSLTSV